MDNKQVENSKRRQPRVDRSERGQSLVELAVSFTLVMFILSGAVDFGRAFFDVIALRDAAQEGVVYASLNPEDETGVERRIRQSSDSPIDMSTIPVEDISLSWSHDDHKCAGFYSYYGSIEAYSVTVTIDYDFEFTMPMIGVMFPDGLTFSIDDTYAILAPDCE